MTRTVVESKTKTVVIGFDEPFCVIGERINPTGRKKLAPSSRRAISRPSKGRAGTGRLRGDGARCQFAARVYNSNPLCRTTEPPLMRKMIELVQGLVDVPLCIDSSVPGALEAGLRPRGPPAAELGHRRGRAAGGDPAAGQEIQRAGGGDLQRRHRHFRRPRRALCRGQEDRRTRRRFRHPAHDIVVDPLVMPIGAMATAGQQVFTLVRRLREELGVNTTCGASNISFGLPHRHGINNAFLPMAIGAGMTSAIMNPVRAVEMEAIRAANFLMNHDPNGLGGPEVEYVYLDGVVPYDITVTVSNLTGGPSAGTIEWFSGADVPAALEPFAVEPSAAGTVDFIVGTNTIQTLGYVPAGSENILIEMDATGNVSLQIVGDGELLVGGTTSGPGLLWGPTQQSVEWNGVTITYSGFADAGKEWVYIEGELSNLLKLTVDIKPEAIFSDGSAARCPGRWMQSSPKPSRMTALPIPTEGDDVLARR
jgi:5-methyltetrahydrofolate--homocysteine methyltransferase